MGQTIEEIIAKTGGLPIEEPPRPRKIKMVCGNCGSDDCGLDATARWNVETQKYELSSTFDDGWCDACGDNEVTLEEEEIDV